MEGFMLETPSFSALYVDVQYMDIRALERILELARAGLPVCLRKHPNQPGKNKSSRYEEMLQELTGLENVSDDFGKVATHPPLLQGDSLPWYWGRVLDNGNLNLFLAQGASKGLVYPVYSGQSYQEESVFQELTINWNGTTISHTFEFKPYQSLMISISPDGEMEYIDIEFVPKDPVVREREKQRMYF